MEEKEFEQRKILIQAGSKQATNTRGVLSNIFNDFFLESVKTLISLMQERDEKFAEYIEVLKDFTYGDKLTSPSDLFPGIRTVSDTVDPEELGKKSQMLKDDATDISNKNKEIENLGNSLLSTITKGYNGLKQLCEEEDQVADLYMDLLKDLDSIYDIGRIARAT